MVSFAQQFQIERGITAIIGGGGKTTLMYRLAEELSREGSVIVTTSTRIYPPEHLPVLDRTNRVDGVVCLGSLCPNGKLAAPQQSFDELAKLADYVLVEADGSAGLPLKAHASHEPVIPKGSTQVICVVGMSGIGQPLCQVAHRPELYASLAEASSDTSVSVQMAATVLNKENLHTRVFLNQSDTPERIAAARELQKLLPCPVLIGSLHKGDILCSF